MNPYWRHPFPGANNTGMNPYQKYPGPAFNDNGYNNRHYRNQQQPHTSTITQSNSGWNRPGISLQYDQYTKPKADEDLDGDTDESDEEMPKQDPELARKSKELKEIEKQIMMKKASLAQKNVNVEVTVPEPWFEKPKSTKSLRERVKQVLHGQNREIRTNSSLVTFRKHFFTAVHYHPLKLRVVQALQQRFDKLPEDPQKCKHLKTSPPQHKEASPVKEEVNTYNQGFLRFLSLLNKGVDINKLTDIVNGETDGIPNESENTAETDFATTSAQPPVTVWKKSWEDDCFKTHSKRMDYEKLTELVNDEMEDTLHDRLTSILKSAVGVREKIWENDSFIKTYCKKIDNARTDRVNVDFLRFRARLDNDEPTETVNNEADYMQQRSRTDREKRPLKSPVKVREKSQERVHKKVYKSKLKDKVNEKPLKNPLTFKISVSNEYTSSAKQTVSKPTETGFDESLDLPHGSETLCTASSVKHPVNVKERSQKNRNDEKDNIPLYTENGTQSNNASSLKSPHLTTEKFRDNYCFLGTHNKDLDNDDKPMEGANYETLGMPHGGQTDLLASALKEPVIVREKLGEDYSFLSTHSKGLDNEDKPMASVNVETHITHWSQTDPVKPPVLVREKIPEEKQTPSGDDPHKHLLNVLETLGISLGTDDISRLNERTQERLYGKKPSTTTKRTESADASEEMMNPSNAYCHPPYTAHQNHLMYNQAPVQGPSHLNNQSYPHNTHPFLPTPPNVPVNEPAYEETMNIAANDNVQSNRCLVTLVENGKPLKPNSNQPPAPPDSNGTHGPNPVSGHGQTKQPNAPLNQPSAPGGWSRRLVKSVKRQRDPLGVNSKIFLLAIGAKRSERRRREREDTREWWRRRRMKNCRTRPGSSTLPEEKGQFSDEISLDERPPSPVQPMKKMLCGNIKLKLKSK